MAVSLTKKRYKKRRNSLDILSFLFLGFVFLIIAGISSYLILKLYYHLTSMDYFSLKKIEIKGNRMLTYKDITSYLNINLGENLFNLNISELNYKLKSNPWIKKSLVKRKLPDTLEISVEEKTPFFLLIDKNNIFYADMQGKKIDMFNPKKYLSLPLLSVKGDISNLKSIITILQKKSLPFSWQKVGGVKVTDKEICLFIDDYKWWLELSLDNLDRELEELNFLISDLQNRGEVKNIDTIQLTSKKAWVSFAQEKN